VEDPVALGGLFLVAFLAATVLPAQSEVALVALLAAGTTSPVLLVIVASAGNVLGSATNWMFGRGIEKFKHARWFPVSGAQLDYAGGWYRRWGRWSLLLSWMPIVGDPLTLAAGILREPLWSFLMIVTVAKAGRYVLVAAMTASILG
jgi:membrane protein YqaA with SNARE-associated domain